MHPNENYLRFLPWNNDPRGMSATAAGDDRSGRVYLHDPALQLAAETAIVTRRPLLLRGDPGTGKSSFAPFAARNLGWRYYEKVVTARLEARELLWRFDALERLRDAQRQHDVSPARYVSPGVLWWAFNRPQAMEFLERRSASREQGGTAPGALEPFADANAQRDTERAVVLIDEIDKADPEVPNDLLEVLGLNRFYVDEIDLTVTRQEPAPEADISVPNHFGSLLVVITTNEERDLPPAFLRRCIVHTLREPSDREQQIRRLEQIAKLHLRELIDARPDGAATVSAVAGKFHGVREHRRSGTRRPPGTAEFLDAARVCLQLNIAPDSTIWKQIEENVIAK